MMKKSAEWVFTCVPGFVRRAEEPCEAGIQYPHQSSPFKIARNKRKTRPDFKRRETKMEPVSFQNDRLWSSLCFRRCRSVVWKLGLLDSAGDGTCNVWEVLLVLLHVPAQLRHGSIQHGRVCLQQSYSQTTSDSAKNLQQRQMIRRVYPTYPSSVSLTES